MTKTESAHLTAQTDLAQQLRDIADAGESGAYMPNRAKMLRAAADEFDRLAATTQASTAQAEQTKTWFRRASSFGPWIECEAGDDGATLFLGERVDMQEAATSSTDAQAAAEVRDAALEEAITECDLVLLGVDTPEESVGALNCRNAIRALRAGDTGEQADGGANA